jgi:cellulose biosynthesis protein BcsQ
MAKVILVGSQKGGSGKSTMTSFIANFLSNNSKIKILVIDADDAQQSLLSKRNQEIKAGLCQETNLPYLLMGSLSSQVPELIEMYSDLYDIIMVDLPGNLKQKGVLSTYVLADVILIPLQTDFVSLDSLTKFIKVYYDEIKPLQDENNISCKVGAFLNNVNPRGIEVNELLNQKDSFKDKFILFENLIPQSNVTFGREFNTYEQYNNIANNSKYNQFIEELVEFIK